MSRLAKNIIFNFIGQSLVIILSFIAIRFIFQRLGDDVLGIIYFTSSLSLILAMTLDMGIGSTIVREFSNHLESDPAYLNSLFKTASLLFWGGYLLLSAGVFFIAPLITIHWLNLDYLDVSTAVSIIRILGIGSLLIFPKSLYQSLFRGLQRMEFNNVTEVITLGLQQLGTILILFVNGNIFQVAFWMAACSVLNIIFYVRLSLNFLPANALIPSFNLDVIKRNARYAYGMMVISITATLHTQIDKIIIGKFMPAGVLGYYAATFSTIAKGVLIPNAIGQAAFPHFAMLFNKKNSGELIKQYWILQDIICFFIIPIFALIPFMAVPLFSYIFNNQIAQTILVPATLISIGYLMNGTIALSYILSVAVGQPEITARQNVLALLIITPVTALLIYRYSLIGAALSWILYHIFVYAYGIPKICSRCLHQPTSSWYKHVAKYFLLAGAVYGGGWVLFKLNDPFSAWKAMVAYLMATFCFLVVSGPLLRKDTKKVIFKYYRQMMDFVTGSCSPKLQ